MGGLVLGSARRMTGAFLPVSSPTWRNIVRAEVLAVADTSRGTALPTFKLHMLSGRRPAW